MKVIYRALSLILCIALLLPMMTACSSDDGMDKAISYSLTSEPRNLDPQMAYDKNSLLVIRNIYEGLVRLDQNGKVIPGVAERWTNNADYTEFTFYLRKNAKWSNETPVTAKDFVFAWQRALDPNTKSTTCSPLYSIKNGRAINEGTMEKTALGVTIIDEYTLKVSMEYSYPDFVLQTQNAVFMPCNEEFFLSTDGHYGLDDDYIICNGPFNLPDKGWSHDNYVRTVRNSFYSGEHAAYPRVLYFGIRKSDIIYYELLEKETVQAAAIETEYISKLSETEYNYSTVTDTTWGFLFNTQKNALNLTTIRRALMSCVNDETCTDSETGKSLIPYGFDRANDIIPPSTHLNGKLYRELAGSGFKETYDPNTARSSMMSALKELNLNRMPNITLICPDDEQVKELMYSIMHAWQQYLYIYVNIEPIPLSSLQNRVSLGDYQLAFYPISPASDNPLSTLKQFTSDYTTNPAFLDHPAYDKLIKHATDRNDTESILPYIAAAEKYLNTYVVFYPIYYEMQYYVTQPGVSGIYFSPFDGAADFTNCKFIE